MSGLGGVWSGGLSAQGVSAPGGGGVWSGGVSGLGGVWLGVSGGGVCSRVYPSMP